MRYAVLALLVTLASCASSSADADTFEERAGAIPPGKGRIYFFRSSKMTGSAMRPGVKLNDKRVGKSVPGAYFFVDQDPGSYKVETSVIIGHAVNLDLKAGETVYVETWAHVGFAAAHVRPKLVTAEAGRRAAAKCKLDTTP